MLQATTLSKNLMRTGLALLTPVFVFFTQTADAAPTAKITVQNRDTFGIIKGVVRDDRGKPISNAVVAIFHLGSSKLFKQVRSTVNGSFSTRVFPGKYTILAVAQGFNASTVNDVEVGRSSELNYGFKLERAGSGNTLPEKTIDRNSSKWRVRSTHSRRSIYQNDEGNGKPIVTGEETAATENESDEKRRVRSVVETYFAGSSEGNFTGFNFAAVQELGADTDLIVSGQTGTKSFAPQRFEVGLRSRINENHQFRVSGSASKVGSISDGNSRKPLAQMSFQALDEWKVSDGVILVFGVDYSRFIGAGDDSSIAPRLGLQFDVNSKTRLKSSYTTQNEDRTWSDAIDFEGSQVLFREQFEPRAIAIEDGKPKINKSRRLEFGVERILDEKSNVEASAFFDSVLNRGVGIASLPVNALNADFFSQFDANQQGSAQGFRVVYSRRLNSVFSTSFGYSAGNGQSLSQEAVSNPGGLFENGFFQTFVGQLNSDFKTGTNVRTIFRLSPKATVFAIDPFQGRLAIFDPGLSVLVTQSLPNLGLPFRATAVVDARNLLDFQIGVNNEEGSLKLTSQRRMLRGGISVRF